MDNSVHSAGHSEISSAENPFRSDTNRALSSKFTSPVSNKDIPLSTKVNSEDSDPEFEDDEHIEPGNLKSMEEDEEEYNSSVSNKQSGTTKIRKRGPSSSSKPKIGKNGKKKECEFCGTAATPMWRRGPTGKGTLCNACGVKWSLKFRKKTSPSTPAKDGGEGKMTKKNVKRDLKPEFSPQKPRMVPSPVIKSSPPFSEHEEILLEEMSHQEWMCKFCAATWPANYFKQHEYFGWMCLQCASRHHLVEVPEDEGARQRFKRRRSEDSVASPQSTDFVQEDSCASSDIDSDDNATRLFGSLLNVVENKLVEVQELEGLKDQFDKWKAAVQYNEEQRQRYVDETNQKIAIDLQQFRERVLTLLSTNEAPIYGKLDHIHAATTEVCQTTRTMQRDIQEMRSLLFKDGKQSSIAARLESLEAQMTEVRRMTETTAKVIQPLLSGGLSQFLSSQFDTADKKVASDISQMKQWGQEELNQVKQRMNRIDNILDNKAHSTP